MRNFMIIISVIFFMLYLQDNPFSKEGGDNMDIKITSSAFENGGMVPKEYTCDGKDISPPLKWSFVHSSLRSFAIIADDPDAPMGTWVHWVIYAIPPSITELPKDIPSQKILVNGIKQGINDFRKIGYGGPCPPSGTHRYFFKIYALDIELSLDAGATKIELLEAMKGHILAKGELIGNYKR